MAKEVSSKERVLSHFSWYEWLFAKPKFDKIEADIATVREHTSDYCLSGSAGTFYMQARHYCESAKELAPCWIDSVNWINQITVNGGNYEKN